jgi:hypothetical protein
MLFLENLQSFEESFSERTTGWTPLMYAPVDEIIERISIEDFK